MIWGIKVRRATGEPRYQQVRGGCISHGLYLGDDIRLGLPILLTEGEFDALISPSLVSEVRDRAAHPDPHGRRPGRAGAATQIASLSQAAHCIHAPHDGKDVNEFYVLAGHGATIGWIAGIFRS